MILASYEASPLDTLLQKVTGTLVTWAGESIDAVTFESTLTPPFTMVKPLAGAAAAEGGAPAAAGPAGAPAPTSPSFAQVLKPKLTVYMAAGGEPIVLAPYGDPGPYRLPSIVFTAALVFGGTFALGYFAGKRRRGR